MGVVAKKKQTRGRVLRIRCADAFFAWLDECCVATRRSRGEFAHLGIEMLARKENLPPPPERRFHSGVDQVSGLESA
jgi:hypothetical protein